MKRHIKHIRMITYWQRGEWINTVYINKTRDDLAQPDDNGVPCTEGDSLTPHNAVVKSSVNSHLGWRVA